MLYTNGICEEIDPQTIRPSEENKNISNLCNVPTTITSTAIRTTTTGCGKITTTCRQSYEQFLYSYLPDARIL